MRLAVTKAYKQRIAGYHSHALLFRLIGVQRGLSHKSTIQDGHIAAQPGLRRLARANAVPENP